MNLVALQYCRATEKLMSGRIVWIEFQYFETLLCSLLVLLVVEKYRCQAVPEQCICRILFYSCFDQLHRLLVIGLGCSNGLKSQVVRTCIRGLTKRKLRQAQCAIGLIVCYEGINHLLPCGLVRSV